MTAAHRRISERVSAITESATLAVDAKAKALKAAGRPVIGYGAGEPDFPTPDYIVAAAQRACAEPRFHKYTPAGGLPELRKALEKPVGDYHIIEFVQSDSLKKLVLAAGKSEQEATDRVLKRYGIAHPYHFNSAAQ